MGENHEFGKKGEQLAVDHLLAKGYTIRARNYRYLKAEVDIIAQKKELLIIVEVKARSSEVMENVAETVTKKKIALLVMAADHYIITEDLDMEVRFDIVTILKKGKQYEVTHLEAAFYHF